MIKTISLTLARPFLGKMVEVTFDRPLGSKHPKWDMLYEVNYGFIAGIKAPDGENLDAYYLGVSEPLQKAVGRCIAVVHREDDDDDKLIVVPDGISMTDEEISAATNFQEKWYKSSIVRK